MIKLKFQKNVEKEKKTSQVQTKKQTPLILKEDEVLPEDRKNY